MKTTASGFENFLRDEFTTLPETSDRILATKLRATLDLSTEAEKSCRHERKNPRRDAGGICEKFQSVRAGDVV